MIVYVALVKAGRDYTERSGQCIYVCVVKPEYVCPEWHTNLPQYFSDNIQVIQPG